MTKKRKDYDLDLEEYIDDDYFYSVDSKQHSLTKEEEEYNNFFKVEDTDYHTYEVDQTDEGYILGFTSGFEDKWYGQQPKYNPTFRDWLHLSQKNRIYFIGYINGYNFNC